MRAKHPVQSEDRPLRAVMLARVSTEDQRKNNSLPTQVRDITDYCRIHNIKIVKEVADAESASPDAARKRFKECLAFMHHGEADALVVWKIDRYARTVVQGLAVFQAFKRRGWHLISVKDSIDTSSPMGMAFFQMALVFAELERNCIVYRTGEGKKTKKLAGGYCGGRPPYGFEVVEGRLLPIAEQQEVLRKIRRLHETGLGVRGISQQLNEEGIRPQTAERWNHEQVARVLRGYRSVSLDLDSL